MNINLKLDINLQTILPLLQKYTAPIVGFALIGLFGYTGWAINQAMNVQPAPITAAQNQIKFNKAAITELKSLQVVPGVVPAVPLGTSNPFGQ